MSSDARFWDRAAEKYARSPIKDVRSYEYTLERTRSFLPPHASVLEVGCGTGTTALHLAGAAAHILGTDISAAMIAIARQKLADPDAPANLTFEVAALDDDSLPEGPFDAVMAFNTLHLSRNLEAALSALGRRVRPGGLFISKTVCLSDSPYRLLRPVLGLMKLAGKAPHVLFLSRKLLEDRVKAHGFEILETGDFPASPPCHFIVARRMA
ncbi:class I SAM-dependent methyltransferase [Pannonibacter phragmitetus]|uniref:class I SAM-dependent methyltransferase n=1 Tax=Pannonibacter phragmitetus TaxID=121719 RepID=UPI003D2ED631